MRLNVRHFAAYAVLHGRLRSKRSLFSVEVFNMRPDVNVLTLDGQRMCRKHKVNQHLIPLETGPADRLGTQRDLSYKRLARAKDKLMSFPVRVSLASDFSRISRLLAAVKGKIAVSRHRIIKLS